MTTATHDSQNFNTIIQNPIEDVAFERQTSQVGANYLMAFAAVWEGNKLLTLTVKGTKKTIACLKAILGKVVGNFVKVSAGENVDK